MAATRPQPDPDAHYDRATPEWWLTEVRDWDWQTLDRDKWRKSGSCPRCGHVMYRVAARDVVVFSTGTSEGTHDGVADEVFIECNCTEAHDGRPDGEAGCGPSGQFPGPLSSGPARVADATDHLWERKRADLVAQALPDIRSAAEKWCATIAALTGILGVASFIGGRDDLAKLSHHARLIVGIALGIAAVLAVIATILAAIAAQGTPAVAEQTTAAFRLQYENAISKAATFLTTSRWVTIGALVALAVAVGFMLFGDSKESTDKAQAVVVLRQAGTSVCGILAMDARGNLQLTVGKTAQPLGKVRSVIPVDSCP